MDNENGKNRPTARRQKPYKFYIIFPLIGLFMAGLYIFYQSVLYYYMGLFIYLIALFVSFVPGVFLNIELYLVRKKGRPDSSAIKSAILESIIFFLIPLILYALSTPGYLRIDQAHFTSCLQSLSGLKVAEEMYKYDHGTYSNKGLAVYFIPGEEKPSPEGDKKLEERISRNCDGPAPGKAWTLDLIEISQDKKSYVITGRAKDVYNCLIEISPKGYEPDSYKDCFERWKKGPYFAAQFRKQRIYAALVMFLSALSLFIYMYLKYRPRKNTGVIQPEVD